MADQLLSIVSSNLESVAGAIRSKAGLSSSQKLVFPDTDEQGKLGMVSALQGITTVATVTPKIAAQQVTLTKDSTSFSITPGFHDGTGTVSIDLQSKTVTPSGSKQTITPDTGKLLSQVVVNGVSSSGYKVVTGTIVKSGATSASISSLSFSPIGAILLVSSDSFSSSDKNNYLIYGVLTPPVWSSSQNDAMSYGRYIQSYSGVAPTTSQQDIVQFGERSVTFYNKYFSSYNSYYTGTYFYIVWGQ